MAAVVEEMLRKRVDEWKQRLIDLTRKNHLLCYKPTKSSTIEISAPGIEEIFRTVCLESGFYKFWLPSEEETEELVQGQPIEEELLDKFDGLFNSEEDMEGKRKEGYSEFVTVSKGEFLSGFKGRHNVFARFDPLVISDDY